MATNLKRKTPCASVKRSLATPGILTTWCNCCGEWQAVNGSIVRYVERTW